MIRSITLLAAFMLGCWQGALAQNSTDSNRQYKGIVVYIDYPDAPAWIGQERLDSLINGRRYAEEGASRSFRQYWLEQSRRNFDIQHDLFFFTAPQNSTHYESLGWQEGILLWKDALEDVIDKNPDYDWRSLSITDDGFANPKKGGILSVMVISSKWGPAGVGASHGPQWTLSNGIKINTIQGSVLRSPWDTTPVNLFMLLHESAHQIFSFPDTYDTDSGSEHSSGTGFYSLMSGGLPDVEPLGGPFLAEYQWGYVVEPEPGSHRITLRADGDSVVVFRNPYDPEEYFTIEARRKSTIGNSLFPVDLGLLVWHTDSKVSTSNRLSNRTPLKHYRNSIEQADGLFELERLQNHRGNAGDIYTPGDEFTGGTRPDTKWWDGTASNFELKNITYQGPDQVQFEILIPDLPERLDEIPQSRWTVTASTPWQNGYGPTQAFDGDPETYYHVPWGNNYQRPHQLIIDLGEMYVLNEFKLRANENTSPPGEGRIADYRLFVSEDGKVWGDPIADGTFFYTGINQYVLFPYAKGRYIKLEAINSWIGDGTQNDVRTSIAEINFRGSTDLSLSVDHQFSDKIVNKELKLFPNPVIDYLEVMIDSEEQTRLEIYSLDGRLIRQLQFEGHIQLDTRQFQKGYYLLKATTKNTVKTAGFIKH